MKKNKKKVDNIFEILLLSLCLIMPMVGYAQSKPADGDRKPNHQQVQVDYLTETYQFTDNRFTEYDLRRHIEELSGVVAVQVNMGKSNVVVKFDKSKNSKSKLKKSLKKLGVPGNFVDSNKKENKNTKKGDNKNDQSKENGSNRENQGHRNDRR